MEIIPMAILRGAVPWGNLGAGALLLLVGVAYLFRPLHLESRDRYLKWTASRQERREFLALLAGAGGWLLLSGLSALLR